MQLSDLVTVSPVKTMFGKRSGEYRAEFVDSDFATVAPSKDAAINKLASWIAQTSKLDFAPRYFAQGEHAGLVWNTPHGVESCLIRSNGRQNSNTHHCSDLESACRSMRYQLALMASDVQSDAIPEIIANDKQSIAEYLSWLAFQRAAIACPPEVLNKHQWACDHQHEFRIERSAA